VLTTWLLGNRRGRAVNTLFAVFVALLREGRFCLSFEKIGLYATNLKDGLFMKTKKLLSLILALMLSTLCLFACSDTEGTDGTTGSQEAPEASPWDSATYKANATVGQGEKTFTLEIAAHGKSITLTVNTNEDVLGDALSALGLIEGEDGPYGLYVKKVNGILADYDVDETYWALYIDGEYAMSGVDTTDIVAGTQYKLSREQ
jgi:hypothetical protein